MGAVTFEALLAPFPFAKHERGDPSPRAPRTFKINLTAVVAPGFTGLYRGCQVRITPVGGRARPVTLTVTDEPVEYVGTGESVFVEARSLGAVPALVHGAVMWGCDAPAIPTRRNNTNLQRTTALDFATMSTDGSNTAPAVPVDMQNGAHALQVAARAIAGGGAMVGVTLHIFGVEAVPDALGTFGFVELTTPGGLAVGPGIPGGSAFQRIPIVPGQFSATRYMVVGFPAVGGGGSSVQVWEEIE